MAKPFEKGDPRINRAGRKPGTSKAALLSELVDRVLARKVQAKTGDGVIEELRIIDAILTKQAQKAMGGDTKAAEFLLDRRYGKPTQHTELTGADGTPLLAGGISDTVARLNGDLTAARADVASEAKQDGGVSE